MTNTEVLTEGEDDDARLSRSVLRVADLTIEEIEELLAGSASLPRLNGTYAIDVPAALGHVQHAVSVAVARGGGRVLVTEWPALAAGRGALSGADLRPPLRAAIVGAEHHATLERYLERTTVPLLNAGTDLHRPLQVLGDLMTIQEIVGRLRGTTVAYVGPPSPYRTSLVEAAVRTGIELTVCASHPDPELSATFTAAAAHAELFGSRLALADPTRAVVHTDVIVGEPAPFGLLATSLHLPLALTGTAADSGSSITEGPRSLLFHREQSLGRVVQRLLAMVGTVSPNGQAGATPS